MPPVKEQLFRRHNLELTVADGLVNHDRRGVAWQCPYAGIPPRIGTDRIMEFAWAAEQNAEIRREDSVCGLLQGIVSFQCAHSHSKQQIPAIFRVNYRNCGSWADMDFA